jgi:hypothetical protein
VSQFASKRACTTTASGTENVRVSLTVNGQPAEDSSPWIIWPRAAIAQFALFAKLPTAGYHALTARLGGVAWRQ